MADFQFRLERVRKVKELLEEKARLDWASKQEELRQEEHKLGQLLADKQDMLAFGYQQTDIQVRQAMYEYIPLVEKRISDQQITVETAEQQVDVAKANWLAKRQEREVLDRLREKKYQEYLAEQGRQEQKYMDELANRSRFQKEET